MALTNLPLLIILAPASRTSKTMPCLLWLASGATSRGTNPHVFVMPRPVRAGLYCVPLNSARVSSNSVWTVAFVFNTSNRTQASCRRS